MSWPEVQSALETTRLVIIPTGSCEQHGPNMTLETDAAICHPLAERLTMFEDFTANGALGDARLAAIEFGQVIVETALERTLEFLQSFLAVE
jgi:creatinine amidohydrolase/Fe(II)-dependent formamide hydrolase-like protein